jgi:hypothetical protein
MTITIAVRYMIAPFVAVPKQQLKRANSAMICRYEGDARVVLANAGRIAARSVHEAKYAAKIRQR